MQIIGSGSSATDLMQQISETARSLTYCTRRGPNESKASFELRKSGVPKSVDIKGEIKRFSKTGAEFDDGTSKIFSVVLFATGDGLNGFEKIFYFLKIVTFFYCRRL